MLEAVKLAIPIKTTVYDSEIRDLICEAMDDLRIAGVLVDTSAPAIRRAVKTYCKLHFGNPEDPERLQASYDKQKAQLMTATGYTDWGDEDEL